VLTPGRDISVVLQGPVHRVPDARAGLNLTAECIRSARAALPGCEVIVSTWDGEDATGLDCDTFVTSPDPGPCDYFIPFSQNVNRQIVNTLAGLRKATRRFAVKLRSDTVIEFPAFLEYQYRFPNRGAGATLFAEKVVASSMGTLDFRKVRNFFSLSDFFFFGLTTDLITLFDVKLAHRPPGQSPHSAPVVSEQYLMVEAMRKAGVTIDPAGPWPGSYRTYFRKYSLTWERFLFANFVIAHPSHLGLLLPRRLYIHAVDYTWWRFDELYDLYCNRPRKRLPLPRRELMLLLASYLVPPR